MADIDDLQGRITAALQRIDTSVEALGPRVDTSALEQDLAAAQKALDEERVVTAQLEERIKGLKDKHAEELADAKQSSLGQAEAMAQVDAELQRLRKVAQQLRENNAALREANAAGLADADLVNASLTSELEALRAERAADVAEASAILSAIKPLVGDVSDHMEGA